MGFRSIIYHFFRADLQVGRAIAEGLGFDAEEVVADDLLTVEEKIPGAATVANRTD